MRYILILVVVVILTSCQKKQKNNTIASANTKPMLAQTTKATGLMLDQTEIELANIKTEKVDSGWIGQEKLLTGQVIVNENNLTVISSKLDGRIDKLYFKNTGAIVHSGQILYEIYSEELASAQKDFLFLLKKEQLLSGFNVDTKQLIVAAKNKMRLWGITDHQIADLIKKDKVLIPFPILSQVSGTITGVFFKEGEYAMAGAEIFKLADFSTLWVQAQVYANEIQGIFPGKEVIVRIAAFPNKILPGKISFEYPQLLPQTKIGLARVEISNPGLSIRPGMQASVSISENRHSGLVVSANAVLRDSKGARVWIREADGRFVNKMVETGIQNNDKIEITKGIKEGEMVVVTGAYLIDSEYIFQKGSNPMAGHGMGKM